MGDARASYGLRATVMAYDPVPFAVETRTCALLRGTTRDKTCKEGTLQKHFFEMGITLCAAVACLEWVR